MDKFINPYTFVPVEKGKKKSIAEYYDDKQLLSGKIECRLKTRTQMSICDQVSEKEFDFFSVSGNPVIPGSSIRGVIRNVYETLTDSCFSSTNAEDDDYFSSRLNKNKCGLLSYENGEYVLYEAKRYKDEKKHQLDGFLEGDLVNFSQYTSQDKQKNKKIQVTQVQKRRTKPTIYYLKKVKDPSSVLQGYIHKVDRFHGENDNYDSIFEKKGIIKKFPEKEINGDENRYIKRLEVNINKYGDSNNPNKTEEEREEDKKRHEDYKKLFYEMKSSKALLPVWYCVDNEHYYFAPSQMSRAVFHNKPADLLEKINFNKCTDKKNVCEACALFGMIGDNMNSISSRLRFSDAECKTDECLEKGYVTVLMGSPRLASFEFYLRYKGDRFTADTEGVNISGRKFYWHDNSGKPIDSSTKGQEKMERKIKLLKKNTFFAFDVYFDNITEEQLKKLIFALNLGENSIESDQCHKIGHGKPLGLGSAKIVCDRVTVRKFEYPEYMEKDYSELIEKVNQSLFDNNKNVEYILKVTDFNAIDGNLLDYPYTSKEAKSEIYNWFANNRENLKKVGKPIEFKQKLPLLSDEEQTLSCKYNKKNDNDGSNRNNKPRSNSNNNKKNSRETVHSTPGGEDCGRLNLRNLLEQNKKKK